MEKITTTKPLKKRKMKKIIISLIVGIFIGALLFQNSKKYLKVVEENKLLKDKIFIYENYIIESP